MMNSRATRARVDGPLGPYADRFRIELGKRGYKPSAATGHLQLMAHLSRWLVEHDLAGVDLTPAATEEFLQSRRAAGYEQWLSTRGLAPLLGYLRDVGFAPAQVSIAATTPEEVLLDCYRTYLVAERGLAASTVRNYLGCPTVRVAPAGVGTAGSGRGDRGTGLRVRGRRLSRP